MLACRNPARFSINLFIPIRLLAQVPLCTIRMLTALRLLFGREAISGNLEAAHRVIIPSWP